MPSVYDLKPKFQALLRPIANGLARAGVTANMVTISAMVLSFAAGLIIAEVRSLKILWILPAVLFVRMALNAIDGMLAREHNQKTPLGAILNELGDAFSDAALYLPLGLIPPFDPRLMVLIVILAVLTEMTGVIGAQIGASRRYEGPMGKSDRAFVFGALGLLLSLNVPVSSFVLVALCLVTAALVLTIFNRGRAALRELRTKTPQ